MEFLEEIDRSIVLLINGLNTPFLDELMWIVSGKLTWVPFYILLLILFFRKTELKKTVVFLLFAILTVAITDQISVHLFKEVFVRYRPSHNALLTDKLHFYTFEDGGLYKGGMFGFISSHAANFFGVCTFAFLSLSKWYKKIWILLISCSLLVGFSRIYLGVHYLSDVLVGGLLGIIVAYLVHRFVFTKLAMRDSNV